MATQVKIKRGTTNANAPTGLTAGEIAINLVDKKLYVGGTAGTNVIFLDSTSSVGLGTANTFTAIQSFSAGISASGATFTGSISGATATFSNLLTASAGISASAVNSLSIGIGPAGDSQNSSVAIGSYALDSNTPDYDMYEGIENVAIGNSVLTSNTTGSFNTAIGAGSMASNTTGVDNLALGYGALQNASTASYNTAIGMLAIGLAGSPGAYNTAIGTSTLTVSGFTGEKNTVIGFESGKAMTTGTNNVGMGYRSLYLDTTGLDNTGIGTSALQQNTTGSNNTGVGSSALRSLTTASQMTALGYAAGRYRGTGTDANTTGTGGIYIGYQARGSALAQTNEIVIGVDALGLGSNTAVIGATTQSAATIYGVLNLPSGLSAAGATFAGTVNHQDNTLSRVELLDYFERYVDLGDFTTASTQIPIDLSTAQVFRTKLTVTCTGLSVTNTPDNGNANAVGFSLLFVGDGTARTMTWNIGNTAASWAGGTAPTYTSTANKIDVFSFLSRDGGSTWLGFVGGQNF